MEIGLPTSVRHIAHVTFDRLNGFLGLPVEFELEVPRRVPSASASVFGVSAESMQCSYDNKGNSVPTILLLLQERLYVQGGLQTEGIFRINPENSQEEHLRDQLNKGIIPYDIDVHCLAGLIKAWFRELPTGVLDSLSPEQVMQCHTEDQCLALINTLPSTQAALMDWAINLMTDVVQEEAFNKMNARNIAVVFAPNMTHMSDPLTALVHAVQVMNLLKTLILKTLQDRENYGTGTRFITWIEPLSGDEDGHIKARSCRALHNDNSALMKKTLKNDATAYRETHNKYITGKIESMTKAFEETEIVEEDGSATGSEWTYSTYSSTGGSRDENEHIVHDQGFMLGNAYGGVVRNDLTENLHGQSQYQSLHKPLAEWLHYGPLHAIEGLCGDEHTYDDKKSCLIKDHSVKSHCGKASYQPSHKPLADWLYCAPAAAIESRSLEKATVLIKAENPIIKMPVGGSLALTECHGRAARALSRRTRHLRSNGLV